MSSLKELDLDQPYGDHELRSFPVRRALTLTDILAKPLYCSLFALITLGSVTSFIFFVRQYFKYDVHYTTDRFSLLFWSLELPFAISRLWDWLLGPISIALIVFVRTRQFFAEEANEDLFGSLLLTLLNSSIFCGFLGGMIWGVPSFFSTLATTFLGAVIVCIGGLLVLFLPSLRRRPPA
ncbi:MAG: hypothetical protein A2664_01535 [Candidatus Taylorbacteria bacterium RIFCSPHIGHO2_01_FULL_46_22b]|uniref:Uncharacterized protein n=1 Tax=Candidatus Taylorbacteria bacterium RIFCSPHIGHO2_01_FULL_46_22b TaxID=1802301 RepID=A0A1G2M2Z6_9BACT|nr:MAG: hypothetical protein A2664_01535 [Candidatus Taylorbacteria bacterium RIFCSPHIGHO2_01_FULL_46_22b]